MKKEITLEESKKICLDILIYFDKFCKEHDIKYSLGEGTLIGAVRHKGFIPWDDDIDLIMSSDQYEKFLSLYKDGKYELKTLKRGTNWWNIVSRLCDSSTEVLFPGKKKSEHGVWIALTPIYHKPDSEKEWKTLDEETKLKRPPKNYPSDFQYIDLLMYRNFCALKFVSNKEVLSEDYLKKCTKAFEAGYPLVDYMNYLKKL
mgnify:CR=1 FL=1